MPNDKTATHPTGLKITFYEQDHKYIDEGGMEYLSVTTMLHQAFPAFNALDASKRAAQKCGRSQDAILAEWDANGKQASRIGTRLHENCERQILGLFDQMHQPEDDEECARFAQGWRQVEMLQQEYEYLSPEFIVFSPRYRIAGSIDLLACTNIGMMSIFDWKIIKELKRQAFNNECGLTRATCMLPNSNYWHYALQLSIYELLLYLDGYTNDYMQSRNLIVWDKATATFHIEQLPDLRLNAMMMLAERVCTRDEVPF